MDTGVGEDPMGSALREEEKISGRQMKLFMPSQTEDEEMWKTPLNPAREEVFWAKMADLNGMRVLDMAHDGSCLYWCVLCWRRIQDGLCTQGQAKKFEGTEDEMREVRESVAVAIETDDSLDANFMVTEESLGQERAGAPKNNGVFEAAESTMDLDAESKRLLEENVNPHNDPCPNQNDAHNPTKGSLH